MGTKKTKEDERFEEISAEFFQSEKFLQVLPRDEEEKIRTIIKLKTLKVAQELTKEIKKSLLENMEYNEQEMNKKFEEINDKKESMKVNADGLEQCEGDIDDAIHFIKDANKRLKRDLDTKLKSDNKNIEEALEKIKNSPVEISALYKSFQVFELEINNKQKLIEIQTRECHNEEREIQWETNNLKQENEKLKEEIEKIKLKCEQDEEIKQNILEKREVLKLVTEKLRTENDKIETFKPQMTDKLSKITHDRVQLFNLKNIYMTLCNNKDAEKKKMETIVIKCGLIANAKTAHDLLLSEKLQEDLESEDVLESKQKLDELIGERNTLTEDVVMTSKKIHKTKNDIMEMKKEVSKERIIELRENIDKMNEARMQKQTELSKLQTEQKTKEVEFKNNLSDLNTHLNQKINENESISVYNKDKIFTLKSLNNKLNKCKADKEKVRMSVSLNAFAPHRRYSTNSSQPIVPIKQSIQNIISTSNALKQFAQKSPSQTKSNAEGLSANNSRKSQKSRTKSSHMTERSSSSSSSQKKALSQSSPSDIANSLRKKLSSSQIASKQSNASQKKILVEKKSNEDDAEGSQASKNSQDFLGDLEIHEHTVNRPKHMRWPFPSPNRHISISSTSDDIQDDESVSTEILSIGSIFEELDDFDIEDAN